MRPITINMARSLACEVSTERETCKDCLFKAKSCGVIDCTVGKMLKRLVDEGFLSIDEIEEGGEE